jgi:hypothetical protein
MTASIYQRLHLARLEPGGDAYLALPHPYPQRDAGNDDAADPLWVIDVARNLSFDCRRRRAELADLQPLPPLNRYVTISLPLIPGMLELSGFNLVTNLVYEAIADRSRRQQAPGQQTPRDRCLALAWQTIAAAFGEGLLAAVNPDPEWEEERCRSLLHDQLTASVLTQLTAAGVTPADRASWANPNQEYPL